MQITHNVMLDVSRNGVQKTIPISQRDIGLHRFLITMRNGSSPVVFYPSNIATVELAPNIYEQTIVHNDNDPNMPNVIEYIPTTAIAETAGTKCAVVKLYDKEGDLMACCSPAFEIVIRKDARDGETIAGNPFNAVLAAQIETEKLAEEAKKAADDAADVLPTVTTEDNGKVMTVENGKWVAKKVDATGGGIDTSDATATTSDLLQGKTAYVDGEKITGDIPAVSSNTITPSTEQQTAIPAGTYASGDICVKGDPNLIPSNIRSGIDIFDVAGSYSGDSGCTHTFTTKTVTPSATTTSYSASSLGYSGFTKFTVNGDSDLAEGNIKSGVSIFGVDGTFSSDATATAANLLSGKTAYVNGSKITGTMASVTQATPSISVSTAGVITASATQSAGFVASGTKSATKNLTTQAAKTVTPTTTDQTAVASQVYTTGAVTVKGDANLIPSNIKSGVSIFGVDGTMEGKEADEYVFVNIWEDYSGGITRFTGEIYSATYDGNDYISDSEIDESKAVAGDFIGYNTKSLFAIKKGSICTLTIMGYDEGSGDDGPGISMGGEKIYSYVDTSSCSMVYVFKATETFMFDAYPF